MNRPIAVLALAALTLTLSVQIVPPAQAVPATPVAVAAAVAASPSAVAATALVAALPEAPAAAPRHAAPASARTAIPATTTPATTTPATTTPATSAPVTVVAAHTAYVNAMYQSLVPATERAALAGHYVLGYNLPGLGCGTGCTGIFSGEARSSFNDSFFAQSLTYQRNLLAHEAAHAYGYLFITNYTATSWATAGGWQAQFHTLDRSFAGTYDAEAWAACVAWKQTGFNNRINQTTNVCTADAAALALAQIR
jgi:hypothetical protein